MRRYVKQSEPHHNPTRQRGMASRSQFYPSLARRVLIAVFLFTAFVTQPVATDGAELRAQASEALHKATEFFRTKVSAEGGYLWRYSEDLAQREGERKAGASTAWVQPPGTPSVGEAYLRAFRATGDKYYLEAARETAEALLRGQLKSGGWDYRIEFDPKDRRRYAYRVDGEKSGSRNVTTLDDDNTQSALRFLIHVDQTLKFKDQPLHEAIEYALACLQKAQYPNGAWPQRYSEFPDPKQFPIKRAAYPKSWSRTYQGVDYRGHYTFNDSSLADMIALMLEASKVYERAEYRRSALAGGDFILLAQMPDPQPGWAQQYDVNMHPAWARKFEPPALTGSESRDILRSLLMLYRETGDRKFLEPVPRAIKYYQSVRLPEGKLARFYELKTNKPLYFTKKYELTYQDDDMPTHYGFKGSYWVDGVAAEYERVAKLSREQLMALSEFRKRRPGGIPSPQLSRRALAAIISLDKQGRWLGEGSLRFQGEGAGPAGKIIDCRTFIRNLDILSAYLAATREQ